MKSRKWSDFINAFRQSYANVNQQFYNQSGACFLKNSDMEYWDDNKIKSSIKSGIKSREKFNDVVKASQNFVILGVFDPLDCNSRCMVWSPYGLKVLSDQFNPTQISNILSEQKYCIRSVCQLDHKVASEIYYLYFLAGKIDFKRKSMIDNFDQLFVVNFFTFRDLVEKVDYQAKSVGCSCGLYPIKININCNLASEFIDKNGTEVYLFFKLLYVFK